MAINRMNDYFVKYLLGKDKNKALSLNFINAALSTEQQYFTDIIFVNKDEDPIVQGDKLVRLDIKGKLNTGAVIDIEVQVRSFKHMGERSLYYWARMYSQQIKKGENYKLLSPAIAINLLDFNLLEETNWFNQYRVINTLSHNVLSDHLNIIFIEPHKLLTKDIKEMTSLEQWGAYFTRKFDDETLREVPILTEVLEAEMSFTADEQERYYYEMRQKAIHDQVSLVNDAKEEGLAEGIAKGRAEGLAEGKAEGRVEGKAEGLAEGENRVSTLYARLISLDRNDDMLKALTDPAYRAQLMQELMPEA